MSAGPPVSVIINNYNYGRFVGEAIESALRQTYANTEVIIVDDGSTDDSREVIRSFGNRIVPLFKENGGQGSTFNAGFAASKGEFVCFLDADDIIFPGAMSEAVTAFQEPATVKVEWKLWVIDECGRQSGYAVPEKPLPQDLGERTLRDGPFYDWLVTPPSSGNCYSRQMLHQVLPMTEPEFRHGADVCLTILAPLYGNVVRLAQPQGSYRQHGGNNYFGRRLDESRLVDYVRRFEDCCRVLSSHLRARGLPANIELWRQRNFNYLWPRRLLQAKQDLAAIVPAGNSYVLIDGDEWGVGEHVIGRHSIPFLERNGAYAGPPDNDEQAIRELERLRQTGASVLVIWWTSFWWLDRYPVFARHLRECFDCTLDAEHLIAFDFRRPARAVSLAFHRSVARSKENNAQCSASAWH
jgi:glycosyltransferase involved in cell wall biosynthesis